MYGRAALERITYILIKKKDTCIIKNYNCFQAYISRTHVAYIIEIISR